MTITEAAQSIADPLPSIKDIQKGAAPSTGPSAAEQLQLIPPIAPLLHVGPDRPFFAACGDTRCGSLARKAVFMAYAGVAQPNGATWRVKGKWIEFYARQDRIATITECGERTVRRETMALVKAGRLVRVQTARGRIPHAYQVVPEGWGPASTVATLAPVNRSGRGVTQAPLHADVRPYRPATRSGLKPVDRPHRPPNRALEEPCFQQASSRAYIPNNA